MRDHVRICGSPGRATDRGHPAHLKTSLVVLAHPGQALEPVEEVGRTCRVRLRG
jgi:hypothetical protein